MVNKKKTPAQYESKRGSFSRVGDVLVRGRGLKRSD